MVRGDDQHGLVVESQVAQPAQHLAHPEIHVVHRAVVQAAERLELALAHGRGVNQVAPRVLVDAQRIRQPDPRRQEAREPAGQPVRRVHVLVVDEREERPLLGGEPLQRPGEARVDVARARIALPTGAAEPARRAAREAPDPRRNARRALAPGPVEGRESAVQPGRGAHVRVLAERLGRVARRPQPLCQGEVRSIEVLVLVVSAVRALVEAGEQRSVRGQAPARGRDRLLVDHAPLGQAVEVRGRRPRVAVRGQARRPGAVDDQQDDVRPVAGPPARWPRAQRTTEWRSSAPSTRSARPTGGRTRAAVAGYPATSPWKSVPAVARRPCASAAAAIAATVAASHLL